MKDAAFSFALIALALLSVSCQKREPLKSMTGSESTAVIAQAVNVVEITKCASLRIGRNWYDLESTPEYNFRWMNTDGELFVVGLADSIRYLRFTVWPGPGQGSNLRSLDLLLNGELVQAFTIDRKTTLTSVKLRFKSKNEVVTIHVREKTIPTATDSRLLNVGITNVSLVEDNDLFARAVSFETKQGLDRGNVKGIFDDAWVSKYAELTLSNHPSSSYLIILGTISSDAKYLLPFLLHVSGNRILLPTQKINQFGDFNLTIPLPKELLSAPWIQFSLKPGSTFIPAEMNLSHDQRVLSFRLRRVELQ
jgi:hypothetical protein